MEPLSGILTSVLVVLLLSSFVKIATALNIFRYGLGLRDATFGLVTLALALAITSLVNFRQIESAGGIDALLKKSSSPQGIESEFRPFLEKYTDSATLKRMSATAEKLQQKDVAKSDVNDTAPKTTPFPVLMVSFLISELRSAFAIGLMLLIPFILVDLIVGNVLMALGVIQMSPALVALPLKLLLFLSVDGWTLIVEKLLNSYH